MGLGVIRIQPEGLVVGGDGPVEVSLGLQGVAEVVVVTGLGRRLKVRQQLAEVFLVAAGIELDRLVEVGDGFVPSAKAPVSDSAVAKNPGIICAEIDRPGVVGDSLVPLL